MLMELRDYEIDLRLMSYWLTGLLVAILAVFGASSYFGGAELKLDVVEEAETGQQVTLEASYSEDKPDIIIDGDIVGEGKVRYTFNKSGSYTVAAETSEKRVEKTVEVRDGQDSSSSTDEPGQDEDRDTDQEQNNDQEENTQDDTQQDEDQTEETSSDTDNDKTRGFVFDGELKQGEQVTVTLYDSGDPVSGEELMIDGESQGETDSDGEIEVTLPYTRSAVFSTSYQRIEDELRPLKESSIDIEPTLTNPADGAEFSVPWDSTKEVNFEFEMEDEADWKLYLNNGVEASGTGSSVSETVEVEPGSYSWKVRAEKGSEIVESGSRDLNLLSTPEISINEGQTYAESNEIKFTFSIYGDIDNYELYEDGELITEAKNSVPNTFTKEYRGDYGEKKISVEALRGEESLKQISRTFSVVEPVAFIDKMTYLTEEGNNLLKAELDVKEEAEYTVLLDGSTISSGGINIGEQNIEENLGNLDANEHEVTLILNSRESSKTEEKTILVNPQ